MGRLTLDRDGISCVTTIYIMFLLATLAFVATSLFVTDVHVGEDIHQSSQALFLAETGIQIALEQQLDSDPDWSNAYDFSLAMGPGAFSVHFASAATSSVTMEATGTVGEVNRKIIQTFVRTGGSVPASFAYVIHAGGNINIQDTVGGVITGDISSGSGTIHMGDITLIGDAYPNSGVPIPIVDFEGYRNDAPVSQRITGNFDFNPGTTYNGVWFVNGTATIKSGAVIHGTVVATGDIKMNGAANVTIDPPRPYPALISQCNIVANGMANSYIRGLVYAAGSINNAVMNEMENVYFFGTIIGCVTVNMNDADQITPTYDPDIMINPPPHFLLEDAEIESTGWREEY